MSSFYEDDEPIVAIHEAWTKGEKGVTAPPTYDVKWMREGEDEVFECRGLTETQFIRRLIGANHNFGRITIVEVERSGDD